MEGLYMLYAVVRLVGSSYVFHLDVFGIVDFESENTVRGRRRVLWNKIIPPSDFVQYCCEMT